MTNRLGPFSENTIVVGDCLDIMAQMPDGCVNLILADPPYNNGMDYGPYYNDRRQDYEDWCRAWFAEMRRVGKRIIITPGHGNFWMWGRIEKPWGVGCWFKPGNPESSVLGWVTWEPWLYYTTDYRTLGGPDTIRATIGKQKGVGNHPCPKPLILWHGLLEKATKEGDLVADFFIGSGTTAVVADRLGRKFFGCDINPDYVKMALERLEEDRAARQLELGLLSPKDNDVKDLVYEQKGLISEDF